MKLKKDFDIINFLDAVNKCSGDIIFISNQNDQLNLKSQLSKYIFIAAEQDISLFTGSSLQISDLNDLKYLKPFVEL